MKIDAKKGIQKFIFGKSNEGQLVHKYILTNANGMQVEVLTYGGIITSLEVPDKNGNFENVVLGFSCLNEYIENNTPYFGAIVGRFCNRIANGEFELEGQKYHLAKNNGQNSLHGGIVGFNKAVWEAKELIIEGGLVLELTHTSPDGDEGFPGNLKVKVSYKLTKNNALEILYEATTDQKTVINLTQHSYFNLSGNFSKDILDHELEIYSDHFLPVDENAIPLGEYREVSNTPFDFRKAKTVGEDIDNDNEQIRIGKGYDHCWVLDNEGKLATVAKVMHPESGREMTVLTTEPGIQLYTGNYLKDTITFDNGDKSQDRIGLCLETQHFPDSPNQLAFPSVVLSPNELFQSKTIYKFETMM